MSGISIGLYEVLLAGSLVFGLILIATGVVLLLKLKNKLYGGLTTLVGAGFAVLPLAILMALVVMPVIGG